MTPKEKTIQLVERFRHFDEYYYDEFFKDTDLAKQCALIAVDEIIEATNMYQYGINNAIEHIPAKIVSHPYWQEVKQEIEKL